MNLSAFQKDLLKRISFKGLHTPEHHELFSDYSFLTKIISEMVRPFRNKNISKVVAIDGAGFLLGALVAKSLKAGLILIRREGAISSPVHKIKFIDYSKKTRGLEIKKRASIVKGERVLIVDDWAETGAHIYHSVKLLSAFQPFIVGVTLIVNEIKDKDRTKFSNIDIKELINFNRINKPDW